MLSCPDGLRFSSCDETKFPLDYKHDEDKNQFAMFTAVSSVSGMQQTP